MYRYHSGYDGGLREERAKDVRAKHPRRLVEEAVRGMLPKSKMGDAMYRKLKVYAGRGSSARGPEAGRNRCAEVRHVDVAVTQIQYYGTGRRKSAAARVFLRPGSGAIQHQRAAARPMLPQGRNAPGRPSRFP